MIFIDAASDETTQNLGVFNSKDVTDNVTNNVTNKRLSEILLIIQKNTEITTSELSKVLKVTKRTILRDIDKLKQNNKLKRIGSEKSGKWEII